MNEVFQNVAMSEVTSLDILIVGLSVWLSVCLVTYFICSNKYKNEGYGQYPKVLWRYSH